MTQSCRYCGASLPADSVFCHICWRSQGEEGKPSQTRLSAQQPQPIVEETVISSQSFWGFRTSIKSITSQLNWLQQPDEAEALSEGASQFHADHALVARQQPVYIPPQTILQKGLVRVLTLPLATNAAVGILLGTLLAVALGGAISGVLVGIIHLIARLSGGSSSFRGITLVDEMFAALRLTSLHSPWRDTLDLWLSAHGGAAKEILVDRNAQTILGGFASNATLHGLLLIPACCLTLGGYVAASTDLSNRARQSLWRGAALALPYALLLVCFVPAVNGDIPNVISGSADVTETFVLDGASLFFCGLLWGALFGLLGASLKLWGGRWRQMFALTVRFHRYAQIGASIAGACAAAGLGLALSLLVMYGLLAYTPLSTSLLFQQETLINADWQSKLGWSLSTAPLYASDLFMYSFNTPLEVNETSGENFPCSVHFSTSSIVCGTRLTMLGGDPHLPPWTYVFLFIPAISLFLGGRVSASLGRAQRTRSALLLGAAIALPFTLLMVCLAPLSALVDQIVQNSSIDGIPSLSQVQTLFSGVQAQDVLLWAFMASVAFGALGGLYQVGPFKKSAQISLRVLAAPLRLLGAPATWLGERLRGRPCTTRPTMALTLLYNAFFWTLILLVVVGAVSVYLLAQAQSISAYTNYQIRDLLSVLLVTLPGLLLLSAGAAALTETALPPEFLPLPAPVPLEGMQEQADMAANAPGVQA